MGKYITLVFLFGTIISEAQLPQLKISDNKRYFQTEDGKPFFWLGDTGWLLFKKCSREEAVFYLEDRKKKGFNVVQAMLLHELTDANVYGHAALVDQDISRPNISAGNSLADDTLYDYWDHIDYIVDEASKRNIYMALVPVWGNNIKKVSVEQTIHYATFLANRFKNKSNIIWINGGDVLGSEGLDKWNAIGRTLRAIDYHHLITYHPRGRNSSSAWFHHANWLDFNMFQSGHQSYAQDTSAKGPRYGEDNWRYVQDDYRLEPIKPTLDGEPSYEDIPYGLHDSMQPYWQDYEVRRYAYWSVFAGAGGFTYGNNEVMQFYTPGDSGISYFPKINWQQGLESHGASQMHHLKDLLLSTTYFDRVPDQSMILDNGDRYDRVIGTRGTDFAMFYTYNGSNIFVNIGKAGWDVTDTYWFNPKNGFIRPIYKAKKLGVKKFNPKGKKKNGNDWVLIIEKSKSKTENRK